MSGQVGRFTFSRGTSSVTPLTGVLTVKFPSIKADEISTVDMDSTAKESIPALPDFGEVSVKLKYTSSVWEALLDEAFLTQNIAITETSGISITGSAWLKELGTEDMDVEKLATITTTWRVVGELSA